MNLTKRIDLNNAEEKRMAIKNLFNPITIRPTYCFEIIRRLKLKDHDLKINELHATGKGFRVVVQNLIQDKKEYEILISPLKQT